MPNNNNNNENREEKKGKRMEFLVKNIQKLMKNEQQQKIIFNFIILLNGSQNIPDVKIVIIFFCALLPWVHSTHTPTHYL